MHAHIHAYIYMFICIYVFSYMYINTKMSCESKQYKYKYVHTYDTYVCRRVCVCEYAHACMHVCMYVPTQEHEQKLQALAHAESESQLLSWGSSCPKLATLLQPDLQTRSCMLEEDGEGCKPLNAHYHKAAIPDIEPLSRVVNTTTSQSGRNCAQAGKNTRLPAGRVAELSTDLEARPATDQSTGSCTSLVWDGLRELPNILRTCGNSQNLQLKS